MKKLVLALSAAAAFAAPALAADWRPKRRYGQPRWLMLHHGPDATSAVAAATACGTRKT